MVYEAFVEMFQTLPIAAEIIGQSNNTFLAMHGGISPLLKNKKSIDEVMRFTEPKKGLLFDLLWSDPFPENMEGRIQKFSKNTTRDISYFFGLQPVVKLLQSGNYVAILRAHEVQPHGCKMHGWIPDLPPQVYTVFSAPNYCNSEGNEGAILFITEETLKIMRYSEVSNKPYFF